ncbi:MAG: YpsA SLOG family protein [Caulobacterales bacterium]
MGARLSRPPGLLYEYPLLQEATSANPAYRTRLNVRDSDATLILWRGVGRLSGGTAATQRYCVMENRPHLVANSDDLGVVEAIGAWWAALCPAALNVAGPRESGSPGAYASARPVLDAVFALRLR